MPSMTELLECTAGLVQHSCAKLLAPKKGKEKSHQRKNDSSWYRIEAVFPTMHAVYNVKSTGPSTEPCRTPYWRLTDSIRAFFVDSDSLGVYFQIGGEPAPGSAVNAMKLKEW